MSLSRRLGAGSECRSLTYDNAVSKELSGRFPLEDFGTLGDKSRWSRREWVANQFEISGHHGAAGSPSVASWTIERLGPDSAQRLPRQAAAGL